MTARRSGSLTFEGLKKLGVVLKRAVYFITCNGKMADAVQFSPEFIYGNLTDSARREQQLPLDTPQQLTWNDLPQLAAPKGAATWALH